MLDIIKKASLNLVQQGRIVPNSTILAEKLLIENTCFFVIRRPG